MGFQQGLSGLSAASKNLEVIGNNVANSNTFGEKSSRAEFSDMYAAAMTGSASNNTQAGIGVMVATVSQQFNQGNITPTGNPLDLAINGNGFFQTRDASNQIQYTRNGQFKVSSTGSIVNDQGNKLMGYPADASGNIVQGAAKPLQLLVPGFGVVWMAILHLALGGVQQPGEHLERRRLPGPVGPQEAHPLAGANLERDAIHRLDGGVVPVEERTEGGLEAGRALVDFVVLAQPSDGDHLGPGVMRPASGGDPSWGVSVDG